MKILVTGATGFIGRNLIPKLQDHHHVVSVTRKLQTTSIISDTIEIDLTEQTFTEKLPSDIDCVIHLAQSTRYREFPEGAQDMRAVNIDSVALLLDWSRQHDVKQFILASTANVYEKSSQSISENDPINPSSFYGVSKYSAELLAMQYRNYFHIDILRLFTVYGPGQEGTLIPNIMNSIRFLKTISLAKSVGVYLSPIFIEDVVYVIAKLAGFKICEPTRIINVCSDQATDLKKIITIMEQLIGTPARIQVTDDLPDSFVGDNSLMKEIIGPVGTIDVIDGLNRVCATA